MEIDPIVGNQQSKWDSFGGLSLPCMLWIKVPRPVINNMEENADVTYECKESQINNQFDSTLGFGLVKDFWK